MFLGFLFSGEEGQQRPLTATRTGKVAVWDIKIKQKKPETKLVREVDLRAESDKFVLCQDELFFALNTAVRQISLQNSQAGAERVYSGEEPISWLCVATGPGSDPHTGPAGSDW